MKELSISFSVLITILLVFLLFISSWLSFSIGQTDGYCSALGGSPIGITDTCNINGKVVKVE